MLLVALATGIVAYAAVGFGLHGKVPGSIVSTSLEFVAAGGAAFAVQRWLAPRADPAILPVAFALTGIGLAMIYRIDHQQASAQLRWIGVGAAAFCLTIAAVRDDRDLDAFTYTIGLAGIVYALVQFDRSYPLGGYPLSPKSLGFTTRALTFLPTASTVERAQGYFPVYDMVNQKVRLFRDLGAGRWVEPFPGTNLSHISMDVAIVGY